MVMMKIQQVYSQFNIPPGLQHHMLTVAAVGKYVIDHWQGEKIDQDSIITTLLVHDLGNLVKFNLGEGAKVIEPALFTDEWREIQQQLITKYGTSSHEATLQMLAELKLPAKVQQLAFKMDAGNVCNILNEPIEQQICEYADLRVVPGGIVSLKARLNDLKRRYSGYEGWSDEQHFAKNFTCAQTIENLIQQQTSVDITAIPKEKIDAYLVELARFEIKTD